MASSLVMFHMIGAALLSLVSSLSSMTIIGDVEGLRTVLHVCVCIMVKGILVRFDISHQCYLYLQHYIGIYVYVLHVCV